MSRTMDVFDVTVGSFGGNQKTIKNKNIHKFYEEKAAFIKAFANQDEYQKLYNKTYIKYPGKVFTT